MQFTIKLEKKGGDIYLIPASDVKYFKEANKITYCAARLEALNITDDIKCITIYDHGVVILNLKGGY